MNLPPWAVYTLVAGAIWGHFAIHLAAYNRINAVGMRRKTIKRIVKLFMLNCVLIPVVAAYTHSDLLAAGLRGELTASHLASISGSLWFYGVICLVAVPLLGIPWLCWRPIFGLEATAAHRHVEVHDVAAEVSVPIALTRKCRIAAAIPWNQFFEVAVEQIELPVVGLPRELDGYRIAQLTDVHLTGHISPAMTAWAVDQANDWSPDMIALTGDIIDRAECIDWLGEALGQAAAKDGCYFLLGNHDTRVPDPHAIRAAMTALGWYDIGGKCIDAKLRAAHGSTAAGEVLVQILGNERPWFGAPSAEEIKRSAARFRLLLSHSPDQLSWARRHGIQLMLAGHTHGGQGRLPLAGPMLSPSWHGSRYASGDFYKPPTTMHVSRGLSGVHLLRINCRPELSLLTLRCSPGEGGNG
jgi:uncharacterized protein